MDTWEKYYTAYGMRNYGGSFVQALGEALAKADAINTKRIKESFPEYCDKYRLIGKEKSEEELNELKNN